MKSIAIDVSGLAWKYRTGAQNLYWAFVDAYCENSEFQEKADFMFYDISGTYNTLLALKLKNHYWSNTSKKNPHWVKLFNKIINQTILSTKPNIDGKINHVWNWPIYSNSKTHGSITIPDLLPLDYPEWFSKKMRVLTSKSINYAKNEAEYIFCISNHVRDRLIASEFIDPIRVQVAYPGISSDFFVPLTLSNVQSVLKKYDLNSKSYLIASGFIDPRKNLINQIEAFHEYNQQSKLGLKFALIGKKTNLSGDILKMIDHPDLRNSVVFLGYVPGDDLKILVSESLGLMYCSIEEGFGLPIIEAMALRVPVITSATSSMKELAENRSFLVNPHDSGSIAKAIEQTIEMNNDSKLRILTSNREYASKFTVQNWLQTHLNSWLKK